MILSCLSAAVGGGVLCWGVPQHNTPPPTARRRNRTGFTISATHVCETLDMVQHIAQPGPPGQRIGYARVSAADQHLDRQITALGRTDRLFTDQTTGSTRHRPGLDAALTYLRDGDELVVTSMDRLARSVIDLRNLVDQLTERGVTVTFLREAQSYSPGPADPMSRLMLDILGAVAEFERAIIRERQADGIAAAKKRGAYRGRARALTDTDLAQARQRIAAGVPKTTIARDLGVHRSTLHRALAHGPTRQ